MQEDHHPLCVVGCSEGCRTQLKAKVPPAQMEINTPGLGTGLHVRAKSGWEKFPGTAVASAYTNLLRNRGAGPDESEFIQERKAEGCN